MALEVIAKYFGKGQAKVHGQKAGDLYTILTELQGLKVTSSTIVSGTLSLAPVTGMTAEDTVIAVLEDGEVISGTAVAAAGGVALGTAQTASDVLTVIWFDKSGA